MTHDLQLKATVREVTGKSAHKLASQGLVPAVVYGPKVDTTLLAIDRRDFEHLMHKATVGASLIDLTVEGHGKAMDVIIREVRHDEVKGLVQHIDFWAPDMGHSLQTAVPITFVGSAEGERTGGVMMHVLHELHVEARPKDLPEHIEVDVSPLAVGESMTVGDIVVPRGVTLLDEPETVIASVMAPAVEEEAAAAPAGEVEVPEVGKETEAAEE